jgi:cell division transport system permease protein
VALRVEYIARETGTNLWRNFTLTVAAIITMGVCLSMFGVSWLTSQATDQLTRQWKGGIEFIVFMDANATQPQIDAIGKQLEPDTNPDVKSVSFMDKNATFAEFKEMFKDKQQLVESVSADVLPPSFRVVPKNTDADYVESLADQFVGRPGVREVAKATDEVRNIEDLSTKIKFALRVVSIVLLVASGLLIFNTIQMAINSRRREIEVMKLVGATNWFIRIPFMLEGMVHGAVGAMVAFGAMVLFKVKMVPQVNSLKLFEGFQVTMGDVWQVSIVMLVVSMAIGVIGSAIAVSRHLDV